MSREAVRYRVEVGGRSFEVAVDADTGAVTVDGEPFDGDLEAVGDADYSALVDGRSINLTVEPAGAEGAFVVVAGPHAHEVRVRDLRELARASTSARRGGIASGGLVQASMPGIVTQILVAGGDTVEVGQPLLILEAMKMENEIAAGAAGRVTEVHVTVGQSVSKGDKLVAVEPVEDKSAG
jgi:glutaconyl-CoA/methylmalonyl-CoA decarboxylase subunit gamma